MTKIITHPRFAVDTYVGLNELVGYTVAAMAHEHHRNKGISDLNDIADGSREYYSNKFDIHFGSIKLNCTTLKHVLSEMFQEMPCMQPYRKLYDLQAIAQEVVLSIVQNDESSKYLRILVILDESDTLPFNTAQREWIYGCDSEEHF